MTSEERTVRMMSCAYNPPGGFLCQLGGYPPLDCECCTDYISVEELNQGGEADMNDEAKGVKIYVPTDELWEFYLENKKRLQSELVLIAENTDTDYAVYMTEDSGVPVFSVCKGNDSPEYEEYIVDSEDCRESANRLILRYLVPFTVTNGKAVLSGSGEDDGGDDCLSRQDMEDEIYEREDELDLAIKDFLAVVLNEKNGEAVSEEYGKGFASEVLHHILEYLTDEHGIQIYRPMFLQDDESGGEAYYEYPYEAYTFSGEEALDGDDAGLPV